MNRRAKFATTTAAAAIAVAAAAGIGIGHAFADDDGHEVTGPVAEQARTAATSVVPGGAAGEVETETNEGVAAYGVDVTKPDGTVVEVHLDKDMKVLGTEPADQDEE
ncbi:PepSY domain-containing protein [Mycolicibacterium gadium]|uniref:PepSY domain-containing protein n=1 Tax=Mycolicibacterium gadium TaxID=1794 RepID=A0A7I7WH76_MYCGU|nr:PepSY domain-containing protein [Mycolicibacterium gadium]BBZ15891.1 hypothetical protein MGAD_02260 [Mycolicibacterium gadium]